MASLGWVTPGAATKGVTPLFFPEKTWRPFFLVASSAVLPLISSSQKLTTFFCSSLFIAFTRVSPPSRVSPYTFLPVRPRFSTILCKFVHKIFFPSVSPGAVCPPHPPSDTTVRQRVNPAGSSAIVVRVCAEPPRSAMVTSLQVLTAHPSAVCSTTYICCIY